MYTQFIAWKTGVEIHVERLGRPAEWVRVEGNTVKLTFPDTVKARIDAHLPVCMFRQYDSGEVELAVGEESYWCEIETYVKSVLITHRSTTVAK